MAYPVLQCAQFEPPSGVNVPLKRTKAFLVHANCAEFEPIIEGAIPLGSFSNPFLTDLKLLAAS